MYKNDQALCVDVVYIRSSCPRAGIGVSRPVKRKRGTVKLLKQKILLLCFRINLGFIKLTTIDIECI